MRCGRNTASIGALALFSLMAPVARDARAREREEAQRELNRLGKATIPFLEEAANSSDPEVSMRAREILASLSGETGKGRAPLRAVELSQNGNVVMDLLISKDCRRWTAVCGRSVMIGAVDEQGGTPVVSASFDLSGWISNGFILDDGRKCLTLGYDGVMTLWGIDRPGNAGKP